MARPVSLHRQDSIAARSDADDLNVFADRYALDEVDSATDNHPHVFADEMSRRFSTSSADDDHNAITSVLAHYAEDPSIASSSSRKDVRNSIRKSKGFLENPFGSREDEDHYGVGPSMSSGFAPRMTAESYGDDDDDEEDYAETHSQHRVAPSHNYSRFIQTTTAATTPLTRTPTVHSIITTQSTGRQSLHGPAHPYNMYPQNVDEDLDDTASQVGGHGRALTTDLRIPVGFPGSASRFRHDVDNLSEQLPPYSEYPEDGAPRHVQGPPRIAEVPTPTSASTSQTVIPLGRGPQSMSDATHSVDMSLPTSEASLISHEPKTWREKSWKEKRKTKFCGIPFGWIVLAISVIVFITVVCGAAIGGFLHSQAKARKHFRQSGLLDAVPTTTALSPLPTGSYQLQIGHPEDPQTDCINNSGQDSAWECGISSPGAMALSITNLNNGKGQMAAVYQAANATIGYGTEIPITSPANLVVVTDPDRPTMGPAFQFQIPYTKVVVALPGSLEPAYINMTTGQPAPAPSSATGPSITQHFWMPLTQPGDQPWFCYWNNTMLEGFIYAHDNSTSWFDSSTVCPPSQWSHNAWAQLPFFPLVVKVVERRQPGDTSQPFCQKMLIGADGTPSPILNPSGQPYQTQIQVTSPSLSSYASVYGSAKDKRAIVPGACHCQWFSGDSGH
ncbi:hypothetical protein ANO11243_095230 [Dothideomycetidae sp. 11243]|nr:hypothetical protein ANO11243_095230 [fungal sp. No.11243]